jgi:RHS repeat-associated protein
MKYALDDANGNTLTKSDSTGTTQYTWDFENRLTQAIVPNVGTTTFRYDPFGRRIQKSGPLGTTNYLYDGPNVAEEFDSSGNFVARYAQTMDADEPLSQLRSDAATYYHQDGLGSVTTLSTSSGSLANSYMFDSFGKLSSSTGSLVNPFQYTGRESDQETGIYEYRARYFDPQSGRFISEDPVRFVAGQDFYAYVQNTPTNLNDPLGLCPRRPNCPAVPQAPYGVNINDNIDKARWMQLVTDTDPILSLYIFKKMVGNKMPWDYKQYGWTLNDTGGLGPSPYQEFGNFNFGATGAAWGIPLDILLRGAGYAQEKAGTSTPEWGHWYQGPPHGDDPDDQAQIIAGYNYYKNGCYK